MIARDYNCEMPRRDVAAWESSPDLMLQEVELSAVPRHQEPGPHAKRRGRGTALWNTVVGDAIA